MISQHICTELEVAVNRWTTTTNRWIKNIKLSEIAYIIAMSQSYKWYHAVVSIIISASVCAKILYILGIGVYHRRLARGQTKRV